MCQHSSSTGECQWNYLGTGHKVENRRYDNCQHLADTCLGSGHFVVNMNMSILVRNAKYLGSGNVVLNRNLSTPQHWHFK